LVEPQELVDLWTTEYMRDLRKVDIRQRWHAGGSEKTSQASYREYHRLILEHACVLY